MTKGPLPNLQQPSPYQAARIIEHLFEFVNSFRADFDQIPKILRLSETLIPIDIPGEWVYNRLSEQMF
jgi:hypothetical protein